MKTLVAGWFSFENGHTTAGDLLARDLACRWLEEAGYTYDVALAAPLRGGVDWRSADPDAYSHVVFVCGPYQKGKLEAAFLSRFAGCRLLGLNLSMELPLDVWNPFDCLIERDSSSDVNADIVFLSRQELVPIIGVCLVEPHPEALVDLANAAIDRLLASREASIVRIDTRLDVNETGLRTPAEIESLIARMDAVVTTRLHGVVLALKNGVPVIAIDAVPGGGKIRRQAEKIGWPLVFTLDQITEEGLQEALDYCLTEGARGEARACRERAGRLAQEVRDGFVSALLQSDQWERRFQARNTPEGLRRFVRDLHPVAPDGVAPADVAEKREGERGARTGIRLRNSVVGRLWRKAAWQHDRPADRQKQR